MTKTNTRSSVESIKVELAKVRHECLLATRQNDARRIAHLTMQAAQLNEALRELVSLG